MLAVALPAAEVFLPAGEAADATSDAAGERDGADGNDRDDSDEARRRRLMAAARLLAEGDARAHANDGSGGPALVTLTGQSRPVYRPLAVYLVLRALGVWGGAFKPARGSEVAEVARALVASLDSDPDEEAAGPGDAVALVLWNALCRLTAGRMVGDEAEAEAAAQRVERVLAASPGEGALHARSADDQLDHWTYAELSGLHALANLALQGRRERWWAAVKRVARFHLDHTQPDYTTYEPWGVHAFLRWPAMSVFADQQVHDTQTNMHLSGASAALLPALLLADAAGALGDPAFGAPVLEGGEPVRYYREQD